MARILPECHLASTGNILLHALYRVTNWCIFRTFIRRETLRAIIYKNPPVIRIENLC